MIHNLAYVHPDAKIGENVTVEPFAYIAGDVVIGAASITDPERAQIEDIVKRKTEVGAENIVITLLNEGE